MNSSTRSLLLDYGRAVLLVGLATTATWVLRPLLTVTPFCLMILGVALTAFLSGFRPAALATFLSTVVIIVLFKPRGAGSFLGQANTVSMFTFIGVCLLMSRVATNQRKSRRVVAATEYKLRQVVDSMNEIFLAVDNEWRFVHVNRLFEERSQRPVDSLIGKLLWEEFPNLRHTIYQTNYERARRTGEAVTFEAQNDDLSRWYQVRVFPTSQGLSVFASDITAAKLHEGERQDLERERAQLLVVERAARLEVERVSRMKDEFLATLSHELRTPLNAILGWAELVMEGGLSESEAEQAIATVQRNGRLQLQLIEDLLDMSRIISGKMRLDMRPVQIAQIVEATLDSVRPAAMAREISLALTDQSAGAMIQGDAGRLQQVAWNLLSNAIKFTEPGGSVNVLLQRTNTALKIEVWDSGQGIRADFLPLVFEAFQQADSSTTRRHGGLGLGLGLVRQLVELHGGSIGASSPGSGLGSTFTVTLPLGQTPPAAEEALACRQSGSPVSQNGAGASLHGVKALVVDDDVDARELVRLVLGNRGSVVSAASSAAEALQLLRRVKFDVVITDIGMPESDGFELLQHIRSGVGQNPGGIKVMALTAYARDSDREDANRAGFDLHLAKPVDPGRLIEGVAGMLESRV